MEKFELEDYKILFDLMGSFQEKQSEQRLRGFNDFNILSVVRGKYEEVGLHSQFIYALLDKEEKHYQDELFLQLFVRNVLGIESKEFGEILKVVREDLTINLEDANKRRIDFTIESENYLIGIEMKLYADDQNKQLSDYKDELDKRNEKEENTKKVIIYYLTIDGENASRGSSNGIEYQKISFQKEILKWINACIKEVANITNLSVLLSQYRDIILQITKQYKGNVMELDEYIKQLSNNEQEKTIKILEMLTKKYPKMKEEKLKEFFAETLPNLLREEIKKQKLENWKIEFGGEKSKINTAYKVHIKFFKDKDWKIFYCLRFEANNMENLYWAITQSDRKNNLKEDKTLQEYRKKLGAKQSDWSLLWKYSEYQTKEYISILEKDYTFYAKNIIEEFISIIREVDLDELNQRA